MKVGRTGRVAAEGAGPLLAREADRLRPGPIEVPRLAWLLGRAYARCPSWTAPVWGLVTGALLFWPMVLVDVHGRRAVRTSHAYLSVHRGAPAAVGRSTLVGWVGLGVLFGLVFVGLQPLITPIARLAVLLADGLGLPQGLMVNVVVIAPAVVLLAPVAIDLVPMIVPLIRHDPSVRAVVAQEVATGADVWSVTQLAAWPKGRGHGGALLAQLMPLVPADVTLVTVARDPGLAALYERAGGLVPIEPGSLVMVRRARPGLPP